MREIGKRDLLGLQGLAVVALYKEGCKPCEQLDPVLEQLSTEYGGVQFCKSHFVRGGLAQEFKLGELPTPTLVVLRDGKLVEHFTGAKYAKGVGGERVAADSAYLKRKLDKVVGQYSLKTTDETAVPAATRNYAPNLETQLALSENALITLRERYLKKDREGRIAEKPEEMFMRVAGNIAQADRFYNASDEEVDASTKTFYDMMADLDFLPNSPTLMNAGRDLQQLSACFVLPIEDSVDSIFETAKQGALVHKSGGGTGYSFSRLRPKNSVVQSTNGVASGPVSFVDVFNVYTETVKQGGTRRGANMGVLRVDHPDVREFIHAKGEPSEISRDILREVKKTLGLGDDDLYIQVLRRKLQERIQLNNFNISVALTEEFFGAVNRDDYFELRNPHTGEVTQRIKAGQLLDEIVDQAWKSGDPGIMFLDRINECNPTPHMGEIEATNPCGEQPLLPYESCNLGSINLARFVREGRVDFERLRGVVYHAVHFLDNVIDMNKYPLPEIEKMTKGNRKVGLGVMGFGDMTTMLRIPYGSKKSLELAEEVMRFIRDEARKASITLAEKRGIFPNWKGSIYDPESPYFKGEELRLRNATLTTIAPTGTLSQIVDCEFGIEPAFSLAYTKTVMDRKILHYRFRGLEYVLSQGRFDGDGIFAELEQGKRDKLEALPEDIKALAVTSMRLSNEQHIRVQAAFQKYTDNAVSKTINLPRTATREDIREAYLMAHKLGCKGITVYRDGSKDVQVLEEKVEDKHAFGSELPKERLGIIREEMVGDGKRIFVITGYWETPLFEKMIDMLRKKGIPTEFFVDANFFDPRTQGLITAFAIRASKDLRMGIPLEGIIKDLRNLPPSDETGFDEGFGPGREYTNRSITDAIWKAISGWKPPKSSGDKKTGNSTQEVQGKKDNGNNPNNYGFCTNCSRYGVISREGCVKCIHCGFSPKGCD